MFRGWLLFAASVLLAATAIIVGVVGLSIPPLLLLALALAGGSYTCWSRAREQITDRIYTRVGVEQNPDGTIGDEGARAERSRTGKVTHEPRDDWDDPENWPFDDPFWTGEETETDGGTTTGDWTDGWETGNGPSASGGSGTAASASGGGVRFVAPRAEEACDVLGVGVDATPEEVRAAYRERVKETHPDRGGSEAAFKRVRWAYEYLREHHR